MHLSNKNIIYICKVINPIQTSIRIKVVNCFKKGIFMTFTYLSAAWPHQLTDHLNHLVCNLHYWSLLFWHLLLSPISPFFWQIHHGITVLLMHCTMWSRFHCLIYVHSLSCHLFVMYVCIVKIKATWFHTSCIQCEVALTCYLWGGLVMLINVIINHFLLKAMVDYHIWNNYLGIKVNIPDVHFLVFAVTTLNCYITYTYLGP